MVTLEYLFDLYGAHELALISTPRQYQSHSMGIILYQYIKFPANFPNQFPDPLSEEIVTILPELLNKVNIAINDAYALVAGYVTLDTAVKSLITDRKVADITRWLLADPHPSEEITKRAELAIAFFKEDAVKLGLGVSPSNKIDQVLVGYANVENRLTYPTFKQGNVVY